MPSTKDLTNDVVVGTAIILNGSARSSVPELNAIGPAASRSRTGVERSLCFGGRLCASTEIAQNGVWSFKYRRRAYTIA